MALGDPGVSSRMGRVAIKFYYALAHTLAISTAICNLCKGPGWAPVALGPSFAAALEVRKMGFVQQLGWPGCGAH